MEQVSDCAVRSLYQRRLMTRWSKFIFLCSCILLQCAASATAQTKPSAGWLVPHRGTFLSLSDIHFNPFADPAVVPQLISSSPESWDEVFGQSTVTHISTYGEETNYNLLVSAFKQMYYACPFPDFIMIPGDLLAHDFRSSYFQFASEGYEEFVSKTVTFIGRKLGQYFPRSQFVFTLGNNDAYDDYLIAPNDGFLLNTEDIFYHGYLKGSRRYGVAFNASFLRGGQYTLRLQVPGNPRIVAVNSIFLSANSPYPDAGWSQLEWLRNQLQGARRDGERIWIVAHIPPGIDVWSTLNHPDSVSRYWDVEHLNERDQTFVNRFKELCDVFHKEIAGIFSGHSHMDHFRLVSNERDLPEAFVHITPALSPQFGNNPAFQVVSYDVWNFDLLDVITYYYDGFRWEPEYSFAREYKQDACRLYNLQSAFYEIYRDEDARRKFSDYYDASSPTDAPITDGNWQAYWCGIAALTDSAFEGCYPLSR